MSRKPAAGFTLIELMVAVSIASLVTMGIQELLNTGLTSWRIALEEANSSRVSDDLMTRLLEGDYELPGLRDAVEIINANENSISFVPLWNDFFEFPTGDGVYTLNKKLRPGASPPIGEIKFRNAPDFQMFPLSIDGKTNSISFGFPVSQGSVVRISYHPDVREHVELIMKYEWLPREKTLRRYYDRKVSDFELKRETIPLSAFQLRYYDGFNRELTLKTLGAVKQHNLLKQITAVGIQMEFQGGEIKKTAQSFVNIRALGKGGPGIILEEGDEILLPSSQDIKLLHLNHFSGISDGQVIELKIASKKKDDAWRFKMELGNEGGEPVARHYEIYYPASKLVYERTETISLQGGFDLLQLDPDGRYDYDDDEDVLDDVSFKGDQNALTVLRFDADGVMLTVRP